MSHRVLAAVAVAAVVSVPSGASADGGPGTENPAIDMKGYMRASRLAMKHRESRRLPEDAFIRMSREAGTIVLDARSREKYDELHVKGALNLSFPDITVASLAKTIPDKKTRILIYCNNNFRNAEAPFPAKRMDAALNLSTYVSLFSYGYENVYELGPLLDLQASKLAFESNVPADGARASR